MIADDQELLCRFPYLMQVSLRQYKKPHRKIVADKEVSSRLHILIYVLSSPVFDKHYRSIVLSHIQNMSFSRVSGNLVEHSET
jgi:hypothetical protein